MRNILYSLEQTGRTKLTRSIASLMNGVTGRLAIKPSELALGVEASDLFRDFLALHSTRKAVVTSIAVLLEGFSHYGTNMRTVRQKQFLEVKKNSNLKRKN